MFIKSAFRQLLFDIHYPQEYLCTAKEKFIRPFQICLYQNEKLIADVSDTHILLGYKPVIIGIPSDNSNFSGNKLLFTHESNMLAELKLDVLFTKSFDDRRLTVYAVRHGNHKLISQFHQRINSIREKLRIKKAGNIFLKGNLYDQVRIAYSVPRMIALATVSDGTLYNLFPTDLHGSINKYHYVDSLRINGNAARQVEEIGRIVISEVDALFYREVYAAGKNHMTEFNVPEHFPFSASYSDNFNWLIPKNTVAYKELELTGKEDVGIHRLLFFKIINERKIANEAKLSHVHRYTAEWRRKNGIITNYLIR